MTSEMPATTKAQKHNRALQDRTKAYGTGYELVRAWQAMSRAFCAPTPIK
jgi:hypothetical protein